MSRKHRLQTGAGALRRSTRPRRLRVGQRPRIVREDRPVLDAQRHPRQRLPTGGAGDALARLGHVVGTVGGALHVLTVLGEELVLDPVESHRDVAAAVHVGVERAAHVDEERLDLLTTRVDEELLAPTRRHLVGPADGDDHGAGSVRDAAVRCTNREAFTDAQRDYPGGRETTAPTEETMTRARIVMITLIVLMAPLRQVPMAFAKKAPPGFRYIP